MPRSPWRPVGKTGEAYPDWLRALRSASGVYAIRVPGFLRSHVVVYVGESHSGRLAKTIVRHFQEWRRGKGFWAGMFSGSEADPGRSYPRAECEVCFETCRASQAVERQRAWIAELGPRDNVLEQPDGDPVPF